MTELPGPGLVLSAYAAAPACDDWKPAAEAAYLAAVCALPGVDGLEIPFYGDRLHRYDGASFLRSVPRLPQHLHFTITTIPDTMDSLGQAPGFGLASGDPDGRRAALRSVARAAEAVRRLNDAAGRRAVTAVHLFSAPRPESRAGGPGATAEALRASLTELSGFQWDGARPVVEHCDAAGSNRPPVKGFLSLEAEIDAVVGAGAGTGIAVNWARSVIEQRDVTAPLRHAGLALEAGVLAGAVLSGCASVDTEFGAAWDDVHLPPDSVAPQSLLTAGLVRDFATAVQGTSRSLAGVPPYRGLKVSAPPGSQWQERVAVVALSLAAARTAGWLSR